jgi:general stress protein YciG
MDKSTKEYFAETGRKGGTASRGAQKAQARLEKANAAKSAKAAAKRAKKDIADKPAG